jgi:hypothetical protein
MGTDPADERFGCDVCWPPSAAAAWEARGKLADVASPVDDSHLLVSVLLCPGCTQRFVYVFLEFVDWADGDDPQYCTLLPVTEAEAAELAEGDRSAVVARVNALPPTRRCLQHDSPKGEPVRTDWGRGIMITG